MEDAPKKQPETRRKANGTTLLRDFTRVLFQHERQNSEGHLSAWSAFRAKALVEHDEDVVARIQANPRAASAQQHYVRGTTFSRHRHNPEVRSAYASTSSKPRLRSRNSVTGESLEPHSNGINNPRGPADAAAAVTAAAAAAVTSGARTSTPPTPFTTNASSTEVVIVAANLRPQSAPTALRVGQSHSKAATPTAGSRASSRVSSSVAASSLSVSPSPTSNKTGLTATKERSASGAPSPASVAAFQHRNANSFSPSLLPGGKLAPLALRASSSPPPLLSPLPFTKRRPAPPSLTLPLTATTSAALLQSPKFSAISQQPTPPSSPSGVSSRQRNPAVGPRFAQGRPASAPWADRKS